MKKIIFSLVVVMAVLLLNIQMASAIGVKIVTNDMYADGTLYSFSPLGTVVAAPDGTEDSWAVARISEIKLDLDGDDVYETFYFDKDTATYELTVYAYGFDDALVTNTQAGPAVIQSIQTIGGNLAIYQDFSKDFDPAAIGVAGAGAVGADLSGYGVTDGSLWLSLTGHAVGGYTLTEYLNNQSTGYTGAMFMDVLGGTMADQFNNNMQPYGSDVEYSFSAIVMANADGRVGGNWDAFDDGTAITEMVPEPTAMLLLGLGLVGLAGLRRKVKA